jgi:hypothetical protein
MNAFSLKRATSTTSATIASTVQPNSMASRLSPRIPSIPQGAETNRGETETRRRIFAGGELSSGALRHFEAE